MNLEYLSNFEYLQGDLKIYLKTDRELESS